MTVGRTPLKKGTNTADEASVRKKVGQQQSEGTLRKRHQPGGGWGVRNNEKRGNPTEQCLAPGSSVADSGGKTEKESWSKEG